MSAGNGRTKSDGRNIEAIKTLSETLPQVNLNAAGIDVGAESHYVAVPDDRAEHPVREFGAYTVDLHRLSDWLAECGVETVALESTGVYWIPLYAVLEERGFAVLLVDPHKLKNVPGRKTDVSDCQWLQQLHTYGLLASAFRPDSQIRRLRSYLRQRSMLIEYASHHIQHMHKALTQMNIKLQHVISDVTGKTGTAIIGAILAGERDPHKLAQLRDYRTKANEETIAKSLEGHWRPEHIFELSQAHDLYRIYQGKIAECDREIEALLSTFEDRSDGRTPPDPSRQEGLPAQRAEVRRAHTVASDDGSGPERDRRDRRLHRAQGDKRDGDRHDQVADSQALRLVAGSVSEQQNHRRQGAKLAQHAEREPRRNCTASGSELAAPIRQCAGSLPAAQEGATGSAQGNHGHSPQAGPTGILDAQIRTRIRRRRTGLL